MDDDFDDEFLANLDIPNVPKYNMILPSRPPSPVMTSNTKPTDKNETSIGAPVLQGKPVIKSINKSNCILVNSKQRGNPLLKAITNIPWEYDEIVPDYVVGLTACILFLSLRYHTLNPDYINQRIIQLGKKFELRVLLVQIDMKEPHNALKHLTRICLLADLTLMVVWNADEAGKVIETYKMYENKPPDAIMERVEQYPYQKLVNALTNIKPTNKTDAMTLVQNYGTLANLISTSEDKLSQCPGLGPRKAKKLFKTFNEPFLN